MALGVLEDGRGGLLAVAAELEHGARGVQRVTQLARVDREAQRLLAQAVENARHAALAAQPPRGARVRALAGLDGQAGAGAAGHGRPVRLALAPSQLSRRR